MWSRVVSYNLGSRNLSFKIFDISVVSISKECVTHDEVDETLSLGFRFWTPFSNSFLQSAITHPQSWHSLFFSHFLNPWLDLHPPFFASSHWAANQRVVKYGGYVLIFSSSGWDLWAFDGVSVIGMVNLTEMQENMFVRLRESRKRQDAIHET